MTVSNLAHPFSPVNPPRVRKKCEAHSARMKAMTDDMGSRFPLCASVSVSVCLGFWSGCSGECWCTGEGEEETIGEVGTPKTCSGGDGCNAGCEGARKVVKRPVLSSKATLASSSTSAAKTCQFIFWKYIEQDAIPLSSLFSPTPSHMPLRNQSLIFFMSPMVLTPPPPSFPNS